jgi:uridine kinase
MDVEIELPSGKKKKYGYATKTKDIVKDINHDNLSGLIVAVRLNNEIVSLSYPVTVNGRMEPVTLDSEDGTTLYKRTLCFLLAIAARQLFPDRRLVIGHSLGAGYYYYFDGYKKIASKDLVELTDKITQIVRANHFIQHVVVSYEEAVRHFENNNQPDTALFLKYQNKSKVLMYRCGKYLDLAHGPLLSRTGLLKTFEIHNYPPGFLLRFPGRGGDTTIPRLRKNPVLFSIYQEYKSWGKILNMNCVGHLNRLIMEGNVREFVQVAEALHDKKIANIADKICERRNIIRLVFIAGPSSSGKTTFSKKLAIQLRVLGRNPVTISLDNYFLPKTKTPLDMDGNPDFERLEAIDVPLLNSDLRRLLENQEVEIPVYNFLTGERKEKGTPLGLPSRSVLILEGIHGLNDRLTPDVIREQKFKIYVSALTQLNLDDHNRISTTDNRLIRRIVRDYQFRGHSAFDTLRMWSSVRRGEDRYIFPFQNTVDIAFNSALDYELSVLKSYAEPLLRTVKPDVREYAEAARLLSFLESFLPIKPTLVPPLSILREFIGESEFTY